MIAWYNENSYRDWPFIEGAAIPRQAVVDAGFTVPLLYHSARLSGLYRVASTTSLLFTFVDSTGLQLARALFAFQAGNVPAENAVLFTQASGTTLGVTGFIVLGTIATLNAMPEFSEPSVPLVLEPSVVDTVAGQNVLSIGLINAERPMSSVAVRYGADLYRRPTTHTFPDALGNIKNGTLDFSGITGHVRLYPGFSCAMSQSDNLNTITIGGTQASPVGKACQDIPLDPTEQTVLANFGLLGSQQSCREVLRSVNGAIGPDLKITAGSGLQVVTEQSDNGIRVTIQPESFDNSKCIRG